MGKNRNWVDKIAEYISPGWALRRYALRQKLYEATRRPGQPIEPNWLKRNRKKDRDY